MRNALAFIIYFAIGIGIVVAYSKNHNKPLPPAGSGAFAVACMLWPAMVAADVYRTIGPKDSADE
jgi:hypothetical protein